MRFAVLIKATGNVVDSRYWPCDTTLQDIINACTSIESPDWTPDDEPSEPGDSEYSYLATENRAASALQRALIENIERSEDSESLAYWALLRWENDTNVWWATCSDYQASGVLTRAEFEKLRDSIGAYADDVQTLGTLGGPANPIGLAPDIDYRVETSAAIVCMRVTPLLDVEPREDRWERVRSAILAVHGC